MMFPSQVLTSWIFQTRALCCPCLHWRSCSCSQLSSSPTIQPAPVQVNTPAHTLSWFRYKGSSVRHSVKKIFSFPLLSALQLFSMSTHNWLRNVESKENIHSRSLANSGESRRALTQKISKILKDVEKIYSSSYFTYKWTLSHLLVWAGGSEDLFGPVLNFFHSMATLRVTEAEYSLLTATALLCSGQTGICRSSLWTFGPK